jgi:hypothetical protein
MRIYEKAIFFAYCLSGGGIMALLESDPLFQITSTFSGKPNTGSFRSTMGPQNWYRYIFPDSIVKTYNITVVGDSAFIHAIWTFKG